MNNDGLFLQLLKKNCELMVLQSSEPLTAAMRPDRTEYAGINTSYYKMYGGHWRRPNEHKGLRMCYKKPKNKMSNKNVNWRNA